MFVQRNQHWLNFTLKTFIKIYCLSKYQFSSFYLIIQEYLQGLGYNCVGRKKNVDSVMFQSKKIHLCENFLELLRIVLFPSLCTCLQRELCEYASFSSQAKEFFENKRNSCWEIFFSGSCYIFP